MKIILKPEQQLFFTSDTHYSHKNICRATTEWKDADDKTRDFKSLNHMNDTIVNNINRMVGEDDILFHLGDWSFGGFEKIQEFRDRIVCKNIHLILGNHDEHIERNKDDIRCLFTSVNHYINLDIRRPSIKGKGQIDKYRFICMHFPIASWDEMNNNVIHLHGHVHLPKHQRIGNGRSLDVGVDGNGLEPISLDEVVSLLKDQPIDKLCLPRDHHVKRLI
jgi:calcineurin-like phosphoesterase family protein